jgi:hypothetical protein
MGGGPAGFRRRAMGGGLGMNDDFGNEEDDIGLGMGDGLGMGAGGRHGFADFGEGLDQWGPQGLGKRLPGGGPGKRRMRRDRPPMRRRRGTEMDPLGDGPFMSGGNGLGGLGGLTEGEENMWEDGMYP